MEGAVTILLGIILVIGSLILATIWWRGRHERHERGTLPLHLAGQMIDSRGRPVSFKKSIEAFIAHWQMLVAIWLLFFGVGLVLSGA